MGRRMTKSDEVWLGPSFAKDGLDVAENCGPFIGVEFHYLTDKNGS